MSRQPPILLNHFLHNTPEIELWPANTLRARSNTHARLLARAHTVLRRKRDGSYLAAATSDGLHALIPTLAREPGLGQAQDALQHLAFHPHRASARTLSLPLLHLHERLQQLELDADSYAATTGLSLIAEPNWLAFAGFDQFHRPLWLHISAAQAWLRMQAAAQRDDIFLDAISGYRSHDYQLGIFERKRARGMSVADILAVNAAPGFSEHHSGLALDIGTPDEPPAEESFEHTAAFTWLTQHAGEYGFFMSYPRDNPHGIIYEPWHWRFAAQQ